MIGSDGSATDAAVLVVAQTAERNLENAMDRLAAVGVDGQSARRAIDEILARGRLTLNFHPDRHDSKGRTVAAGLLADGRYRSQFETGISNGGRFAVAGGDRARWETLLFGGVYDGGMSVRPVYGALDIFGDPYGGSPRFGSSFIVLNPACFARATFCMGDSHLNPKDVGTIGQMMPVFAGAIEECATGNGFGRKLSRSGFLERLNGQDQESLSARELDRYIEAQVHGSVDLATDVAAVHLDPSFRTTQVHHDLQAAAVRYGFDLTWSEGSEVRPADIDPGFRGAGIVALAHQTAGVDGVVDAAAIGRAMVGLPFTPPSIEGDAEISPRQRYKKLWHCCLRYGAPPSALR